MNSLEFTERLTELFRNGPGDNIERLPEDVAEVFDKCVVSSATQCLAICKTGLPIGAVFCGAIAQSFFAGHDYAVKYGNLNAEMEGGKSSGRKETL